MVETEPIDGDLIIVSINQDDDGEYNASVSRIWNENQHERPMDLTNICSDKIYKILESVC